MRKRMDIIGQRYGRLIVISELETIKNKRRFYCKCDCGEMTEAYMMLLRNGHKKSCGCLLRENKKTRHMTDLAGMTFDYLTVVKRSFEESYRGRAFWICECKCGGYRVADGLYLRRGLATECSNDCLYYVDPKHKCNLYTYSRQKYMAEYHQKRIEYKNPR